MTVVVNSGPIIHLSWIGYLTLLRDFYDEVLVAPAVRDEVLSAFPMTRGFEDIRSALAEGWLRLRELEPGTGDDAVSVFQIDRGEREAIRLALQLDADVFVSDDSEARRVAAQLGLEVIGTLGILKNARNAGLISSVYPLAVELRRQGQWIGESLLEQIRLEETAG